MFLTYDEAMGRFRGSNARDAQTIASAAAGIRSTPTLIKWVAFFMMLPGIGATITIFGAIVGIPWLIVCGIIVSKANTTLRNIKRAQDDYTRSLAAGPTHVVQQETSA